MATFAELQKKLTVLSNKAVVYQHLIDHLEGEFRGHGGLAAKKTLLGDTKLAIPDDTFSEVVTELYAGLASVTSQIQEITGADMSTGAPAVPVVVAAPVPVVAPVPAKKTKSTTQGDAQS